MAFRSGTEGKRIPKSEANSTAAHKQQQTHSDRLRVKRGQGKPVFVLDRMKVGFVQIELCQSRDV